MISLTRFDTDTHRLTRTDTESLSVFVRVSPCESVCFLQPALGKAVVLVHQQHRLLIEDGFKHDIPLP